MQAAPVAFSADARQMSGRRPTLPSSSQVSAPLMIASPYCGRFQIFQHLIGFSVDAWGVFLLQAEHHHHLQQFMFDIVQNRHDFVDTLRNQILER